MIRTCLTLFIFTVMFAVFGWSSDVADGEGEAVASAANGTNVIPIQPLDHPDNPYRDAYGPWDAWMLANCTIDDLPVDFDISEMPEGWRGYILRVNADGWVLPQTLMINGRLDSASQGEYSKFEAFPFAAYAMGVMPPEMKAQYDAAIGAVYREYYPPVPDWLADNPPARTTLLPDGRFIGESSLLDLDEVDADTGEGSSTGSGQVYALYSHDGQLLATAQDFWMQLTVSAADLDEMDNYGMLHTAYNYRYIAAKDRTTGEITKAWDYDGTEVDVSVIDEPINLLPFRPLPSEVIRHLARE